MKPFQVAFWSLLVGFVATLALALPRIDLRPMAIIAGRTAPETTERAVAASSSPEKPQERATSHAESAATVEYDELPPPPESQTLLSVRLPGSETPGVTMANTSHRSDRRIGRDAEIPHSEPAPGPDDQKTTPSADEESLIEIGTIVVPSLAAQREETVDRDRSVQDEQFAARDRQIADLERRLDRLQDKMDRLLTTQVEHQTAELESLAKLVEQIQKDRDRLRLTQQLDDLRHGQPQAIADRSNENAPPRTETPSTRTEESTAVAAPPHSSNDAASVAQPKTEGWVEVTPPRHDSTAASPKVKPHPPAARLPSVGENRSSALPPSSGESLPVVIPETPLERDPVVPVPDPAELELDFVPFDVVPFPIDADELPEFKIPPHSPATSAMKNTPAIEFEVSREERRNEARRDAATRAKDSEPDYTIPPEFPSSIDSPPAQSNSSGARTTVVPAVPPHAAEPLQPAPRDKLTSESLPAIMPSLPVTIDVVVFNVQAPASRHAVVDWSRLQDDTGNLAVDFAPSANRNAREAGLAIGALATDLQTFQGMLREIADVEVVSREQLTLSDRLPSFVALAGAVPVGEATSEEHADQPGLRLKVLSEPLDENRSRLVVSLIDSSAAETEPLTGDAVVSGGESLVIGGMMFEEIVETPADEPRFGIPFLGRKKTATQTTRIVTEQVIVISVTTEEVHGPTAVVPEPAVSRRPARKVDTGIVPVSFEEQDPAAVRRVDRLAEREFQLAEKYFEYGLFGPAQRHVQVSLELNPEDLRTQQLAARIAAAMQTQNDER